MEDIQYVYLIKIKLVSREKTIKSRIFTILTFTKSRFNLTWEPYKTRITARPVGFKQNLEKLLMGPSQGERASIRGSEYILFEILD